MSYDLGLAIHVATKMLRSKKETGRYVSGYLHVSAQEDASLFLGNAGIGYFYLRLLEPLRTPSILAPHLSSQLRNPQAMSDYRYINLDAAALHKRLTAYHFPRTLSVMERHDPAKLSRYFYHDKIGYWRSR